MERHLVSTVVGNSKDLLARERFDGFTIIVDILEVVQHHEELPQISQLELVTFVNWLVKTYLALASAEGENQVFSVPGTDVQKVHQPHWGRRRKQELLDKTWCRKGSETIDCEMGWIVRQKQQLSMVACCVGGNYLSAFCFLPSQRF